MAAMAPFSAGRRVSLSLTSSTARLYTSQKTRYKLLTLNYALPGVDGRICADR